MEEIKKELLELGFNVNSIGIMYWLDAIKYVKENPLWFDMIDIYDYIAEKYNSTFQRVERCMRTAINPAKKNIQEKYGYYQKINNGTFLGLIKFKLI